MEATIKPSRHLYLRVSSESQDYTQQRNTIDKYLVAHSIDPKTGVDSETVEKVSGTVKHTERKLAELLAKCKPGDTIYVSELSRLARSMADMFNIATEASERGITLIQCKDGSQIENQTIGGKALLFALSLAAEIEVQNNHQRTQSAIDAIKKNIEQNGYHVAKYSGKIITQLGSKKGADMSKAGKVSALHRIDEKIKWHEENKGYKWVMDHIAMGWSRQQVIDEFNRLHEENPEIFSTRGGTPLSKGILSRWIAESGKYTRNKGNYNE